MDLTVKKDDLIKRIAEAKDEFEKTYVKAVHLYAKKVEEYLTYVRGYAKTSMTEALRHPPPMPSWDYAEFIRNLRALEAHQEATLKMDDGEYNNILDGITRIRHSAVGMIAALNETSYVS